MTGEYENLSRIRIDAPGEEIEGATWVPVCSKCGRFVKVDELIGFKDNHPHGPNATCRRCGRVEMLFEGFV